MLLDYAEMYPNAICPYKSSDMVLHVDLDAAYLTMTDARTYYSGRFYLSDWPSPSPIKTNPREMAPYTQSVKQSKMFCTLWLKLKRVAPSTTVKHLLACNQP